MIVRQLNSSDVDQARAMWITRFDDSPSFVNWYFDNRFLPEYSFGSFDNGELLSISHGYPTRVRTADGIVPALMISGVSTKQGHEHKGYMHRVITAQMEYAHQRDIPLAFNKPVNINTYTSLGFVPCTDALFFHADRISVAPCKLIAHDYRVMSELYANIMRNYFGSIVREEAAFAFKMEDYLSDDAKIVMSQDGYAVYFVRDNEVYVDEMLCSNDYLPLLCAIIQKEKLPLSAKLPPDLDLQGEVRPMCVFAATDQNECTTEELQRKLGYITAKGSKSRQCFCIEEY
ncbi:MAG: GNAT family N-acetyltransferase [Eubacteriales bacterium]|nr:GNAT family N-acetyltransferase [Eubacteriales bacterium]